MYLVAVMAAATIDQLARWADGHWSIVPTDWRPSGGFSNDTRRLREGQIFVALRGVRDGHEFVAAAARAGACGAIVEQIVDPVDFPQLVVTDSLAAFQRIARGYRCDFAGKLVGITGSCGKTSTKDMLSCMLGLDRTHATAGNYNNTIGVPLTLTGLDGSRHDYAVVEAGISVPGEMLTLATMIEANISIVTAIAPAHLEGLGSVDGVAAEKAQLAMAAVPGSPVVVPQSVAQLEVFSRMGDRLEVLAAADSAGSGRVWHWAESGDGCSGCLTSPDGLRLSLQLPVTGAGMRSNFLLAAIAAALCGRSQDEIQAGVSSWRPGSMRGEILHRGEQTIYLDCYNANPLSMVDAIRHFEDYISAGKRRLYILGSMGELGAKVAEFHREVAGELRVRTGDGVILIGRHARDYREGLQVDPSQLSVFKTVESCLEVVSDCADFDGAILIKGSRSEGLERLLTAGDSLAGKKKGYTC